MKICRYYLNTNRACCKRVRIPNRPYLCVNNCVMHGIVGLISNLAGIVARSADTGHGWFGGGLAV